jgi:hypothetical protein
MNIDQLRELIRELIKSEIDEANVTGTGTTVSAGSGEAYATPYAFRGKKSKKNRGLEQSKRLGYIPLKEADNAEEKVKDIIAKSLKNLPEDKEEQNEAKMLDGVLVSDKEYMSTSLMQKFISEISIVLDISAGMALTLLLLSSPIWAPALARAAAKGAKNVAAFAKSFVSTYKDDLVKASNKVQTKN